MKRAPAKPCASCPFLPLNHQEFGAIAEKLCAKFGKPKPDFWGCLSIRESVKADAIQSGHLLCHATVYDAAMTAHPENARPCAGLAAHLAAMNDPAEKNRRRSYWRYHRDPAAANARNAEWQRANKERVAAKQRAYRARKKTATTVNNRQPSQTTAN